jgi:hypothetical protein
MKMRLKMKKFLGGNKQLQILKNSKQQKIANNGGK